MDMARSSYVKENGKENLLCTMYSNFSSQSQSSQRRRLPNVLALSLKIEAPKRTQAHAVSFLDAPGCSFADSGGGSFNQCRSFSAHKWGASSATFCGIFQALQQHQKGFGGEGALSGFAGHGITVNAAPFLLTSGVHHQPPFVASSKIPHLLPLAGVLAKQNVPCIAWHSTGHEKAGSI